MPQQPQIDYSDLTTTPPTHANSDLTTASPSANGQTDYSDLTTTPPAGAGGSTPPAPNRGLMENIVGGMLKGASETVEGGLNLAAEGVEKLTGMPAGSLQATRKETEGPSVGRDIGEGVENVGEFAAGDAALEGAAKMAKIAKNYPQVLQLMEKFPRASKILLGTAKAATTGAAQGAVKGAADEQPLAGAEGGAIGGAVGGAVGETAGAVAQLLGKTVGIGTTAIEDATHGAKPAKRNYRFAEDFMRAAPYLDEQNALDKAQTVEDWADHADNARRALWEQKIQPVIDKHSNVPLSGIAIRDSISKSIPNAMKKFSPEEAANVERLANQFMPGQVFSLHIADAEEALEHFNAKLASTGYWLKLPNERAALLRTNGEILGYKAAADAIRDELYNRLESLEPNQSRSIQDLKQDYGALRNVGNEIRGQVNVAGRQAPISLKQTIGLAAGIAAHSPVAVLQPIVDKMANAPEQLISRGVQKAARPGEEGIISKGVQAAGRTAKNIVAPAGAMVGENSSVKRVFFTASDGSEHSVPISQLTAARKIDPRLTITDIR